VGSLQVSETADEEVELRTGAHSAPDGILGAEQALILVAGLSGVKPFRYTAFTFTWYS
jgi:hypothetical protein